MAHDDIHPLAFHDSIDSEQHDLIPLPRLHRRVHWKRWEVPNVIAIVSVCNRFVVQLALHVFYRENVPELRPALLGSRDAPLLGVNNGECRNNDELRKIMSSGNICLFAVWR